ncbi:MAG: tetratricopeptide repeat protein, partial [Desulfatitalea sp.]|nr:tetratricopeptide repeat protein [Desulfatitalea sp.]NNK00228.1 tetratricopeptide repeat protein [Desulfatitalea sp.]
GGDPSLANTIRCGLADAFVRAGDHAAAIGHFDRIVSADSTALKDTALFHLGRLHSEAGDRQEAQSAFARLSDEFPDSMYAQVAKEQMAEMQPSPQP